MQPLGDTNRDEAEFRGEGGEYTTFHTQKQQTHNTQTPPYAYRELAVGCNKHSTGSERDGALVVGRVADKHTASSCDGARRVCEDSAGGDAIGVVGKVAVHKLDESPS